MNIGLTRNSYPEKRCIKTSSEHNYIYLSYLNISNYFKKLPIVNNKLRDFVFVPFYNPQVDLYHSFNDICITKKKWVVTFETMLPRFNIVDGYHRQAQANYPYYKLVNSYLKKVASPNCLASIAISQSAFKIQQRLLLTYPEVGDDILKKTFVIYPPQETLTSEIEIHAKNFNKLKLLFIGNDFYRKGGSEVVIAFDELITEQAIEKEDVELILVGDLSKHHNYALSEYQDNKIYTDGIKAIIDKHRNIKYFDKLKNETLLQMVKTCHIGLLPTWADTFGYSVLEFQASGCPVISTNVRALPEINNSEVGWVINVDTNDLGELVIDSYEKKEAIRRRIIDNLKSIIIECTHNKKAIKGKAIKALNRVEEFHSIEKYNQKLLEIYNGKVNC